jgi:hypothetical protein
MNGGTGAAGRFTMSCYLSDDDQLGNDVPAGKAKKIKKLAAGGVVPVAFKLKSVSPLSGKYLIAVIDPANAIQEISEGNNILVVSIP